jgi:3',5'-cyclic AMP phosphodiesterase CpdA
MAAVAAEPIRAHVLVYSDAGFGNEGQLAVARAMTARHGVEPFDFAVSAGDNLQDGFVTSHTLAQVFSEPFAPLIASGLKFFATLGNHDHLYDRAEQWYAFSRATDALGSGKGGFVLPEPYYVHRLPGQKWIFVDVASAAGTFTSTPLMDVFLEKSLCTEREPWMMMVFHYPLWSTGGHGDTVSLRDYLMPLLARCPVNFVFSGHDHHAELFRVGNLRAAIVGNAGNPRIPPKAQIPESVFRTSDLGFAELLLTSSKATLQFRDVTGAVRFEDQISR